MAIEVLDGGGSIETRSEALDSGLEHSRFAASLRLAGGLHEREVSEDEMVKLIAEEYTFVTRPVIVRGDRATAGFAAKLVDGLVL